MTAEVLGLLSEKMVVGISAEADLISITTADGCLVVCEAVGALMREDDEDHLCENEVRVEYS